MTGRVVGLMALLWGVLAGPLVRAARELVPGTLEFFRAQG